MRYSATANGQLYSVKEGAGGRWRIGYTAPVSGFESGCVNQTFFRYMNGKDGDGLCRTAGAAFGNGSEYSSIVRMSGNPWTTLCPAPIAQNAFTPAENIGSRKGWGCLLFDTYMDESYPANQVVVGANIRLARRGS